MLRNKSFNEVLVDQFNSEIETMFDDTRDFIQAHFYLSPRMDTEFWRANKELGSFFATAAKSSACRSARCTWSVARP